MLSRADLLLRPGLHGPGATSTSLATTIVSTIAGLKAAIADNQWDRILIADGTYSISNANALAANSLWIGGSATNKVNCGARTRKLTIMAAGPNGYVFDGTGGGSGKWLAFLGDTAPGSAPHDIDWYDAKFQNCAVSSEGIVKFGGDPTYYPAHHINLYNFVIDNTNSGSCNPGGAPGDAAGASASALEHGFYFAFALNDGPHHIGIYNASVDCRGGLASGFHFFHSSPTAPNAHDIYVETFTVRQPQQGIMLWDRTVHDITFNGGTMQDEYRWALSWDNVATSDGASGTPSNCLVQNVFDSGTHTSGYSGGRNTNPNGDGSTATGLTVTGGNI